MIKLLLLFIWISCIAVRGVTLPSSSALFHVGTGLYIASGTGYLTGSPIQFTFTNVGADQYTICQGTCLTSDQLGLWDTTTPSSAPHVFTFKAVPGDSTGTQFYLFNQWMNDNYSGYAYLCVYPDIKYLHYCTSGDAFVVSAFIPLPPTPSPPSTFTSTIMAGSNYLRAGYSTAQSSGGSTFTITQVSGNTYYIYSSYYLSADQVTNLWDSNSNPTLVQHIFTLNPYPGDTTGKVFSLYNQWMANNYGGYAFLCSDSSIHYCTSAFAWTFPNAPVSSSTPLPTPPPTPAPTPAPTSGPLPSSFSTQIRASPGFLRAAYSTPQGTSTVFTLTLVTGSRYTIFGSIFGYSCYVSTDQVNLWDCSSPGYSFSATAEPHLFTVSSAGAPNTYYLWSKYMDDNYHPYAYLCMDSVVHYCPSPFAWTFVN